MNKLTVISFSSYEFIATTVPYSHHLTSSPSLAFSAGDSYFSNRTVQITQNGAHNWVLLLRLCILKLQFITPLIQNK